MPPIRRRTTLERRAADPSSLPPLLLLLLLRSLVENPVGERASVSQRDHTRIHTREHLLFWWEKTAVIVVVVVVVVAIEQKRGKCVLQCVVEQELCCRKSDE